MSKEVLTVGVRRSLHSDRGYKEVLTEGVKGTDMGSEEVLRSLKY